MRWDRIGNRRTVLPGARLKRALVGLDTMSAVGGNDLGNDVLIVF